MGNKGKSGSSGCAGGLAFALIVVVVGIVVYAIATSGGSESTKKPEGTTTTTTPPATWTYAGRTVEQDEGTGFAPDVPVAVSIIDGMENDCTALAAEIVTLGELAAGAEADGNLEEMAANLRTYQQYAMDKAAAAGCP